ncbi:uncharacterized protein LOC129583654 [Paramacrobiotus metropolitanus]|uniref:uncharacterized protein LOC129583654 n=1 Tax=Paramacrobiotus metropolitanus TaxID=2943436 RepID=UPI002445FC59|nr:uncharacterized protein LOC129583654 [Paramacrobiotus metropolitanus]
MAIYAFNMVSVILWWHWWIFCLCSAVNDNNDSITIQPDIPKENNFAILGNLTVDNVVAAASALVNNRTARIYYGDGVYGDRHDTYTGNNGWGSKRDYSDSYSHEDNDYSSRSYHSYGPRREFFDEKDDSGYSPNYRPYPSTAGYYNDNPYAMTYNGYQGWNNYGRYGPAYGGGGYGAGAYGGGYYQRPGYGGYYGSRPFYPPPPPFLGYGFAPYGGSDNNLLLLLLLLRRREELHRIREREQILNNNNDNNGGFPLQRLFPLLLPLLGNLFG